MMKKFLISLWVLSIFIDVAFAQSSVQYNQLFPKASNISEVGFNEAKLQRMDAGFQDLISKEQIPGAVALVIRDGKVVYEKAFGIADPKTNRPYKVDDIFRIASMSKAITSTAAMILYEQGKFNLDDPISKWIPAFKNMTILSSYNAKDTTYTSVPATKQITVRQLFTHTSGLSYGRISGDLRFHAISAKAGITELYTTDKVVLAENINKLASIPLVSQPGEKYNYALGLDVLGYLIEIWSGQKFDVFLKENLFQPLGMQDASFYLPTEKINRLVPVLKPATSGKGWEKYEGTYYDADYPAKGAKTWFSGGAGLSCTARDYALFLQMLLNNGLANGKQILSPYAVFLLTAANQTPDITPTDKSEQYNSLGFGVITSSGEEKGNGNKGRFSWGGYFNTNYWADPKTGTIMVLLKQTRFAPDGGSSNLFTRWITAAMEK
jgi:CubicO group peptidase (beta-lactamase class C family)